MNFPNKTIFELEEAVTAYLVNENWDEVRDYIGQLNLNYWSKDYKAVIEIIAEHLTENPKGEVMDLLLLKSRREDLIIDLGKRFIPPTQINKLIIELNERQKARELKRIMENSPKKTLEEVTDELDKLSKTTTSAFKPKSLGEIGKERIEEYKLEKIAPSTGYKELDRYIKGFVPGHVYVLSGDTNVGKTAMCSNFVDRISKQGKTSLYFALEPENTIVDYLASIRLRKRFTSLTVKDRLFNDPNVQIFGKERIRSIEDLVKAIRSLDRFDFIVVDHIGYFTSKTANTVAKQSDVMKDLAGLAKERKCAIMLVQHLNKSKLNKKSPEDNITGSASFKQDATDILIITRDSKEGDFGATNYGDTGAILIRKAKSDMQQGAIPIKFITGSAVILDSHDQKSIVTNYYENEGDDEQTEF